MKDNYLVIVGSHVNSQSKKEWALELLTSLKNENIDVCLSTHSNEYLSELTELVDYLVYDYNNEFIYPSDLFKNADLLTTNMGYGHMYYYTNYTFGTVSYNLPHTYHSKPALTLFRNGINVAYSNRYKWVIYIEYDISVPVGGYKRLIEQNIEQLNSQNKKCLYYKNELTGIDFLWGTMIMCDTDTLFKSSLLMHSDWIKSSRDWIKIWGLSFFEYCTQAAINEVFETENIIVKSVNEVAVQYWQTDDYKTLSRSHGEDLTIIKDNVFIHILPAVKSNTTDYELFLFKISRQTDSEVQSLKVCIDGKRVFELEWHKLHADTWFLNKIPYDSTSELVTLDYVLINNGNTTSKHEEFKIKDLNSIYTKIARIIWNVHLCKETLTPKVSVVIAAYFGNRNHSHYKYTEDKSFYMKKQLEYCNNINEQLHKIYIPCTFDNTVDKESILKELKTYQFKNEVIIYERPNVGGSYCSWHNALQIDNGDSDFIILLEDDYLIDSEIVIPAMLNYWNIDPDLLYLCQLWQEETIWHEKYQTYLPPHAGMSAGILNNKLYHQLKTEKTLDFNLMYTPSNEFSERFSYMVENQKSFLDAYRLAGYKIKDWRKEASSYFPHDGVDYGKDGGHKMLTPIIEKFIN